jgi:hypothetical protein
MRVIVPDTEMTEHLDKAMVTQQAVAEQSPHWLVGEDMSRYEYDIEAAGCGLRRILAKLAACSGLSTEFPHEPTRVKLSVSGSVSSGSRGSATLQNPCARLPRCRPASELVATQLLTHS